MIQLKKGNKRNTTHKRKKHCDTTQTEMIHSDEGLQLETIGDLVSKETKETVRCVGGKVKHSNKSSTIR